MTNWQPLETAPEEGRFLVYAEGDSTIPPPHTVKGVFMAHKMRPHISHSQENEELRRIEKSLPSIIVVENGMFAKMKALCWVPLPDRPEEGFV